MRLHEIENWALNIISRIKSGQPIEDSRVELKSEWIDPVAAARRIAGHANSAGGAQILWIIGADETKGITGARNEEFSEWFSKISKQFEGIVPYIKEITIPVKDNSGSDNTVVALLIETERAPFLVKNPIYGSPGGGPVEYEVPWREGTKTRSAKRDDLLRILSPLQLLPDFEILDAGLTAWKPDDKFEKYSWELTLNLYVNQAIGQYIAFPFHKIVALIDLPGVLQSQAFSRVSIRPPREMPYIVPPAILSSLTPVPGSLTIESTNDEVVISGPGKLFLKAFMETNILPISLGGIASISISLQPLNTDKNIPIKLSLTNIPSEREGCYKWVIPATRAIYDPT